jgi:CheY-like chemotaxis protein
MPLEVLYLDDEPELCELFAEAYSTDRVRVTALSNVEEAIAFAIASPPHLIFLDYRLPGTTGDKIAQRMPPGIPKYLVTGDIVVQTEYRFEGVLRKPTDSAEIEALLAAKNLAR